MKNRRIFLIGLIFILSTTSLLFGQEEAKEWVVRKGDSLIIKIKGLERVAIGDANIADVTVVSEDEILINGRAKGTTTLHVWTSKGKRILYRVRVIEKDFPVKEEVDIQELLLQMKKIKGLEEITITPIGDTLILKGRVASSAEREAAVKIASSWAKEVVNLIEVPTPGIPPKEPLDVKGLERQIREIEGLGGVTLGLVGETIVLKGKVSSLELKEAAGKVVAPFTKQVVNLIEVPTPGIPPKEPLDVKGLERQIRQIQGLEGINLVLIGDTLILRGKVASLEIKEACGSIVAPFTKQVVNLIEIEGAPPTPLPRPAYEEISKIEGLEGVEFSLMGENLILKGRVEDQQDKDKAENLAKSVHPKVINLIEVTSPIQVLVKLQLIEIGSDALKEFGVDWSVIHREGGTEKKLNVTKPEYLVDVFNIGIIRTSLNTDIQARLQLLHQQGKAEILSSPTLVTQNRREAYVNMGGKIPIKVVTRDPSGNLLESIQWMDYGVQLKITPTVDRLKNITLDIDSSVSELDWSRKVFEYPVVKEKKVTTQISASNGDTVIISGLLGTSKAERISKVPYLGDIPILGALFKSKKLKDEKTELVVLITPQILGSKEFERLREPDTAGRETNRALELKEKVLPPEERPSPAAGVRPAIREREEEIKQEMESKEKIKATEKEEITVEKRPEILKIKPEPLPEKIESLKPQTLEMVVQSHPYSGKIKLYVVLRNIGEKVFYVGPCYFLLKTEDGDTHYYSYDTYTTPSPFFGRHLEPNEKVEGFLIFNTDEAPKRLIYDDGAGNRAYWDF